MMLANYPATFAIDVPILKDIAFSFLVFCLTND